jgi:acylphosphatase
MRKRVNFKGNVQGVGFRFTAVMISRRYNVTGYVKNMYDGSVELVTEGEEKEIEEFLNEIKERMGMNICSASEQEEPDQGEFRRFNVSY